MYQESVFIAVSVSAQERRIFLRQGVRGGSCRCPMVLWGLSALEPSPCCCPHAEAGKVVHPCR